MSSLLPSLLVSRDTIPAATSSAVSFRPTFAALAPYHSRVERRQLRQLVEIKPGEAPALIVGRIGFAFEVAAIKLRAAREPEEVSLLRVSRTSGIHVTGGVDEILQVFAGLAQDEAPGIFAMPFGVQPEVQC